MNRHRRVLGAVCLIVFAMVASVHAEDWRELARDKRFDLNESAIEKLARNKILIAENLTPPQIFCPYVDPDMPVFITSDSILAACNILLEESVFWLEEANAAKLPEILDFLWKNLETIDQHIAGRPDLVAGAKRRAQIIIGTAIELLGGKTTVSDPAIAALIAEEVRCVQAAQGHRKPSWFDNPDIEAIDYSRYKPRGFYTKTETLTRYFHAVSWLQSLPFCVDRDEELLAILMLGNCMAPERFQNDAGKRQSFVRFFEFYHEFIGANDDWDLLKATEEAPGELRLDLAAGDLERMRQSLVDKAKRTGHEPLVNDQIGGPLQGLSLRILSAYQLPDAVLFQRTIHPFRQFPNGLEVCIALGSSYAAKALNDPDKERIIKIAEESKPLFDAKSLYCDYLRCTSTLLDDPPAAAPAFMSNEPWQAKSCQTTLAGWAQLRHTWILQAKETTCYLCMMDRKQPVGFVEPNPVFFERLKRLSERTGEVVRQAIADTAVFSGQKALQNTLRFLQDKAATGEKVDYYYGFSVWEKGEKANVLRTLRLVMGGNSLPDNDPYTSGGSSGNKKRFADAIARVSKTLSDVEQRNAAGMAWLHRFADHPIKLFWNDLAEECGRLQGLAEKQLAGVPFTAEETEAIRSYGKRLASLMFHLGDASEIPRDDVPRIADVSVNSTSTEYLEVGIGRPQIMFVLYPTPNGEVFCRGAVLPYYEFRSPTRLTDDQWKAMLTEHKAPRQPGWVFATTNGRRWTDVLSVSTPWRVGIVGALLLSLACVVGIRKRAARSKKAAPDLTDPSS